MDHLLQNILLGISLAAPLGPASVAILKSGIQGGFTAAFQVAIGVVSADLTYIFVAYFGLSGFITIPLVKAVILGFGMLVLGYLGVQTLKEAFKKREISLTPQPVSRNLFVEGYAVNISNPLAVVWWLGVIGSILATSSTGGRNLLTLGYPLTIVVGILIWHTGLSIFSHYSKKLFNSTFLRIISILSGLVLLGFALRFGANALLIYLS
jgi:threonine/homoserine/homoserine lactone efflux protein